MNDLKKMFNEAMHTIIAMAIEEVLVEEIDIASLSPRDYASADVLMAKHNLDSISPLTKIIVANDIHTNGFDRAEARMLEAKRLSA